MIWLLPRPFPLSRHYCLAFSVVMRVAGRAAFWRERGEGGEGGIKSYDREKAWPSINHSILSLLSLVDGWLVTVNESCITFVLIPFSYAKRTHLHHKLTKKPFAYIIIFLSTYVPVPLFFWESGWQNRNTPTYLFFCYFYNIGIKLVARTRERGQIKCLWPFGVAASCFPAKNYEMHFCRIELETFFSFLFSGSKTHT